MKKFASIAIAVMALLCGCNSNSTGDAETMNDKTIDTEKYTLYADFSQGSSTNFEPAGGWSNGGQFNCTWLADHCTFEDNLLKMTIDGDSETGYNAAEYRTKDFYHYGMYEVTMKPIKNDGVVSSFFTYTGPSDNNPWDEIDIEFLGKDTTKVQFNYFTNGAGNHELIYDLGFDAADDFHTYAFEWLADSITWYVDGEAVHTATNNIPSTPGKIMMNVWNGIGVDGWLNAFDGTVPLTAEYKSCSFTAAENS